MKYLAMASTALFLLASPGLALAQSTNDGSTDPATGAANSTPTDPSNGGAAAKAVGEATGTATDNNGAASDAPNPTGSDNQCGDETASSNYESFSEKCRHSIDAWAMSQAGASNKFEGDVVVGAVVPDTVEIVEVPTYRNYGYVMLNDRRVLVDRTTHKVVRVY